jgi:hypothetical protein
MKRLITHSSLAGGVAAALIALATTGASAGSQSKTYYVPAGDMVSGTGALAPTDVMPMVACNGQGIESVCFDVTGGTVHIDIADKTGQPTPARIFFYDASMAYVSTDVTLLCGSGDVAVPDGAAKLEVRVSVVGRGTIPINPPPTGAPALACGKPSPATTGTVTASGPGIAGSAVASQAAAPATTKAWSAPSTATAPAVPNRYSRSYRPL